MAEAKIGKLLPIPRAARSASWVRLFQEQADGTRHYYHKNKAEYLPGDGYTVWMMADWRSLFGWQALAGVYTDELRVVVDSSGRHWEFFGWTIPLYDEGDTT